jgi:hypothetical protein
MAKRADSTLASGVTASSLTSVGTLTGLSVSGTINSTGAITQAGNQVLHAGNYSSYAVVANPTTSSNIDSDWGQSFKTFDPVPSGTPPISSPNIRTINIGDNYGRRTQLAFPYESDRAFLRRRNDSTWQSWVEFLTTSNYSSYALPLSGGTLSGSISTPSGTSIYIGSQNVSTSNRLIINWHTDTDYNYLIGKRAGGWTQPMDIAFYTGVRYHAHSTYNGHIFYTGGYDTTEAFSVGKGDSHVRVNNTLFVHSSDNSTRVPRTFVQSGTPSGTITNGDVWLQHA